jgi:hypothetical protein
VDSKLDSDNSVLETSICDDVIVRTSKDMIPLSDMILAEIGAEIERQVSLWGHDNDDKNTMNDWITFICAYATERRIGGLGFDKLFRNNMIKVAALAVSAAEAYDRNRNYPPRHYDEV